MANLFTKSKFSVSVGGVKDKTTSDIEKTLTDFGKVFSH